MTTNPNPIPALWAALAAGDVRGVTEQLQAVPRVHSGDEWLRLAELRAAGQRDMFERHEQ